MSALPYLTADLPGTGGVLKHEPADFEVEEIPAYEPCGEGEHLFLWVEKEATPAYALVRHVARVLGIAQGDIGAAGLKDTRAVTRQFLSVPARGQELVARLETDRIRVLRATRHRNKLKTGHLRGNRFRILVRDVEQDALGRAQAIAERLRRSGVPNFYGEQRFGHGDSTLHTGLELLRGSDPASADATGRPRKRRLGNKRLVRLALSSVQSALFNDYLRRRMRDGLLERVVDGEVMQLADTGGQFLAEDVGREQARFAARQIVPAGPMFGPKMRPCVRGAAEREQAVLDAADLTLEHFARVGKLCPGTRRPVVVWVEGLDVQQTEQGLLLCFELPAGSYATVLMRELMKPSAEPQDEAPGGPATSSA